MLLAFVVLLLPTVSASPYLSETWAMITSDRPTTSRCSPIPKNFLLCHNIQYSSMRLPNLLEHDTLEEAIQQSTPWIPLLRLNCHPDTQLFLCSLFAPVCLSNMDKEILPCRSLCRAVQARCETRMLQYGFPWPEMLNCEKYAEDHDMCIRSLSPHLNHTCQSCSQVGTYENIVDHFCRSEIVLKARLGSVNESSLSVRKARSLKRNDRRRSLLRDTVIHLSDRGNSSCSCELPDQDNGERFLIMANQNGGDSRLIANLILPWKRDKPFKRAIRMFRKLNCHSLGREIRQSAIRQPSAYQRSLKP